MRSRVACGKRRESRIGGDGQRFDIRWRKPSATRHLELVDTSGTVVPLRPGATWIHLAPVGAVPEPGASDDASEAPSEG